MLILYQYTCACDSAVILENLVNTDMGIDSLLEHRYCWFPKTLEMFQDEAKDSPRPGKDLVACADA